MTAHPEGVLEPCPFCGGTNIEIRSNAIGDFYAICYDDDDGETACGASTSDQRCETEKGAIHRWNRRASPPPADREADRKVIEEHIARWRVSTLYDAGWYLDGLLGFPPAVRAALSRLMVG